jgi:long-chain acyl-CoA synthetase
MNIAEWLAASARLYPQSPALMTGEAIDADYAEFARRASAIAAHLRDTHGVMPGDRVALFMSNATSYLECAYGIWWAGAVAVPINAKLHAREALWIVENSGAKITFVAGETKDALGEVLGDNGSVTRLFDVDGDRYVAARNAQDFAQGMPQPFSRETDDLAWLFYTSGTTGRPKGVMLSHGNLIAASLCYLSDVDSVFAHDHALYAAPLSHGAGLYNFIHVRMGARHVVPSSGGFDPAEILTLAQRLGNVSMFAAPTMVKRLVEVAKAKGADGDGIRTIVYGGGPMYRADILDALAVMGPRFVQIYGQGESPMTITALSRYWHQQTDHPHYLERLASVGTTHSAIEVRITDADGNVLPPGETGEIEARGTPVMLGYWNNPEATANTLKDGWLRTGDVGRLDADGFLTLSDRSKDVIISGGTNIYPREVEEALLTHEAVREVSVIGVADPEWGENVVACVVLADGVTPDDAILDAHCLASIARFKRPKQYVYLASLPKNNYGKVLKTELRRMFGAKT